MPASRSIVSVLVRFVVRSFSTNSRPALRAASGRPPARQQHQTLGQRATQLHPAILRCTRPCPTQQLYLDLDYLGSANPDSA
jgi:hypothetical protein